MDCISCGMLISQLGDLCKKHIVAYLCSYSHIYVPTATQELFHVAVNTSIFTCIIVTDCHRIDPKSVLMSALENLSLRLSVHIRVSVQYNIIKRPVLCLQRLQLQSETNDLLGLHTYMQQLKSSVLLAKITLIHQPRITLTLLSRFLYVKEINGLMYI